MAPPPPAPKLKMLVLCGYMQSASVLSGRMGALRKSVKNFAELDFLEPPFLVEPADNLALQAATDEARAAILASYDAKPDEAPRGWWFSSRENGWSTYRRLDEMLTYVAAHLDKNGPYDGVWGFSQGAGLAAILSALLEAEPNTRPESFSTSHGPFRFAVCGAGFDIAEPRLLPFFPPQRNDPIQTASLHILGRGDTMVPPARSQLLADCFQDPRVVHHDGGHFLPSKGPWRNFFKGWLEAWVELESDKPLSEEEMSRQLEQGEERRKVTSPRERAQTVVAPEEAEGGLEGKPAAEGAAA